MEIHSALPSHINNFEVGNAVWQGDFTFRVTSRFLLVRSPSTAIQKTLAVLMHVTLRLFGA
jgi:hypothetical protein